MGKFRRRQTDDSFLIFPRKSSFGDNLHDISKYIYRKKNEKNISTRISLGDKLHEMPKPIFLEYNLHEMLKHIFWGKKWFFFQNVVCWNFYPAWNAVQANTQHINNDVTTSLPRTSWRCSDVVKTLLQRCVFAGVIYSRNVFNKHLGNKLFYA